MKNAGQPKRPGANPKNAPIAAGATACSKKRRKPRVAGAAVRQKNNQTAQMVSVKASVDDAGAFFVSRAWVVTMA
ncbi:MAG: hypothetical protein Q8P40_16340 [Nitrospirota bacterium]|nr:hypothetical protein [Nitrospirota bacterium]